jgi:hypothetical protein
MTAIFQRHWQQLFWAAVVLCLAAPTAQAIPIAIDIEGTITTGGNGFSLGDAFRVRLVYEDSTLDADVDPQTGWYGLGVSTYEVYRDSGGGEVLHDTMDLFSTSSLQVLDDFFGDDYWWSTAQSSGTGLQTVIYMRDSSQTASADDSLIVPVLGSYLTQREFSYIGSGDDAIGTITSLTVVPELSTGWLLFAALAGLAAWRRSGA